MPRTRSATKSRPARSRAPKVATKAAVTAAPEPTIQVGEAGPETVAVQATAESSNGHAPVAPAVGAPQEAAVDATEPQEAPEPDAGADAQGEATAAPAEPVAEMPVITPEKGFGEEPGDLDGEDDDSGGDPVSEALGLAGGTVTYKGLRERASNGLNPDTITVIVPAEEGTSYDDLITRGTAYTLTINRPRQIAEEHIEWLTGHPHYVIEAS